MKCTWQGCNEDSVHDCLDRNDEVWANLCSKHKKELDASFAAMDLTRIKKCWEAAKIVRLQ